MANEPDAGLTGSAFELANAGYVPMSDPDKKDEEGAISGDASSLREVAEQRTSAANGVTERRYTDSDGAPVPSTEAITLERAARDYAGALSTDRLMSENRTSEALAARVDAMRAEALANNPDAAEIFGFDAPEAKAETNRSKSVTPEATKSNADDASAAEGLDPELARALQHPQVAQAIEERIGKAEKTRQQYLDGLTAAQQIAQLSILNQIPELVGISPDQVPGAFERIARQDPARYARIQGLIASAQQMFSHQEQEHARKNFQALAKSEDARFDTMLKGEPKATQRAVTTEIFASAKESGVEPTELMRLFNSEPLMRNAVFQRMMYDAGKYRLMTKARDAATAKAVPAVQRPGLARNATERDHADLRTLSARLTNSGDIKDAVALYNARKSGRR